MDEVNWNICVMYFIWWVDIYITIEADDEVIDFVITVSDIGCQKVSHVSWYAVHNFLFR